MAGKKKRNAKTKASQSPKKRAAASAPQAPEQDARAICAQVQGLLGGSVTVLGAGLEKMGECGVEDAASLIQKLHNDTDKVQLEPGESTVSKDSTELNVTNTTPSDSSLF